MRKAFYTGTGSPTEPCAWCRTKRVGRLNRFLDGERRHDDAGPLFCGGCQRRIEERSGTWYAANATPAERLAA
jgi:hypothetical protein